MRAASAMWHSRSPIPRCSASCSVSSDKTRHRERRWIWRANAHTRFSRKLSQPARRAERRARTSACVYGRWCTASPSWFWKAASGRPILVCPMAKRWPPICFVASDRIEPEISFHRCQQKAPRFSAGRRFALPCMSAPAFQHPNTREQLSAGLLLLQRATVEGGHHRLHVAVVRDIGVRAAVRLRKEGRSRDPLGRKRAIDLHAVFGRELHAFQSAFLWILAKSHEQIADRGA